MEISRAATGLLVAACVTAGAAGTYLVVRGDAPDAAQAIEAAVPSTPARSNSPRVYCRTRHPLPRRPHRSPRLRLSHRCQIRRDRLASPNRSRRRGHLLRRGPLAVAQYSAHSGSRRDAGDDSRPPSIPESQSQPTRPIEPPAPVLDELVVSAQSVIGLQMETAVSSDNARLEDEVVARVTRDVKVGDRVAIPAGARAQGEVTLVERGGRVRERARLGVRFTSIVLADGTRIPIHTETVLREGDSPGPRERREDWRRRHWRRHYRRHSRRREGRSHWQHRRRGRRHRSRHGRRAQSRNAGRGFAAHGPPRRSRHDHRRTIM